MENIKNKKQALAAFVAESPISYDADTDEYTTRNGAVYKIFTDAEADQAAKEEIMNTLWAFNADFILDHSKAADALSGHERAEVIKALQEMQANLCESATPLVRCVIADLDEFIDDAIRADGRGHFIAQYDGDEHDLGGDLYAYRMD